MNTQLDLDSKLAPPLPLRRFSVEQYRQLGGIGVLTPEDRVELLEGWIVEKTDQRPIHGYLVGLLSSWFFERLSSGFIVQCQLPITTQRSEPEPDVAIVRGFQQTFRDRHPFGDECRLIIEVADSSLERDRAKAAIYRSAGVKEYWIINIQETCLERYQFLASADTEQISVFSGADKIAFQISKSDLLLDLGVIFD